MAPTGRGLSPEDRKQGLLPPSFCTIIRKTFQEDTTDTPIEAEYGAVSGEKVSKASLVREIVETLLLTAVIFWAVNAATGRFKIDGSSMEPNLHNGQYIIINKLIYELREPQRGDVVVFRYPHDPGRDFIKRIIGLPGEQIKVVQGQVSVAGQDLTEPYISQQGSYSDARTLEHDEFYVLGDNRNNSSDSHNWGVLPRDRLIGRAWVIYWPLRDWGTVPHYGFSSGSAGAQAAGG